jgi:hypothetical protein
MPNRTEIEELAPTMPLADLNPCFTAVYEFRDGWWIGHVEEFGGAFVQERTLPEAKSGMRESIALVLTPDGDMSPVETSVYAIEHIAISI